MRVENLQDIALYHGDCLEVLPEVSGVGAVLTDPPYGSTANEWDNRPDLSKLWSLLLSSTEESGAFVFFADMRYAVELINSQPKLFRYDLVWKKNLPVGYLDANRRPLRIHEMILVFYRKTPTFNPQYTMGSPYTITKYTRTSNYGTHKCTGTVNKGTRNPTSVVEMGKANSEMLHPTQKPVNLMAWLIKSYTNEGDVVLDPFMGSGTTAVACVQTRRKFIGIEREQKYYDIALRRVEAELRKPTLF